MVVDAQEASRALDDIAAMDGRMSEWRYYRSASPFFILWGFIWLIGNGGVDLLSGPMASWLWMGLIVVGIAGSAWLGAQQGKRAGRANGKAGRVAQRSWMRAVLLGLMIGAFIYVTVAIFGVSDGRRMNAFISVTVGFVYMGMGLAAWAWRVMALGVAVAGLTLTGYFLLQEHFFLWMAVVGGGSLIVGGLLVRRL